jgi:O-antigen/teichoic acid export membrane protein
MTLTRVDQGIGPTNTPAIGDQSLDQPRKGLGGVARGGVANLAGAGFAGLSGIAVTWLVARGLGPAHAGAFFAATSAFVLATGVAKLGAPTSLVYWPARLRARGETDLLGACLRMGLWPVLAAGCALGTALWFAAPELARLTTGSGDGGHGGDAATVATVLRVLAVFLPVAALTDALLSATRGYRTMRPTVLLDRIARPGLQLAGIGGLAVAAILLPVPVSAYPLAWVAPYAPVALLAAYQLRLVHAAGPRDPVVPAPRGRRVRRLRRDFWRFAGPRAVATVAQLGLQRLDVLLVAALAGLPAAAMYAVAGRFVVLGQFANQGISQAVQPRLAEALSTGDRDGANALYRAATGWLVLLTWPMYLLVLAFAPLYLGLFGNAYADGGRIVAVLAAAMLLASGCGMVDMVLAMGGRTTWNLANVALALAVTIGVDVALIPRLGAFGAAIGLAAALAVNNLLPLAQVGWALRVHPFGRGTLLAAALATACFGATPAVLLATGAGPAASCAGVGLATAAYLAGAYALRRPLALDALAALRRPAPARPAEQPARPAERPARPDRRDSAGSARQMEV